MSKRRVSPEDIVKCEERYMKSKTVSSILRHVGSKVSSVNGEGGDPQAVPVTEPAEKENKRTARKARQAAQEEDGVIIEHEIPGTGGNEDEKLEQLYEQIAWPLGKKYGHPYDAFKLALTSVFFFLVSPLLLLSDHLLYLENLIVSSLHLRRLLQHQRWQS